MSSNMISYERFTSLPVNISEFGSTAEEYSLTKGKVETNVTIAPMATRAAEGLLGPRTTSDNLRVAAPEQPPVNEYEGFRHDHITVRGAINKGRARIGGFINEAVREGTVKGLSEGQRNQILASLAREHNMTQLLGRINRMQEGIFARIIGGAKG